MKTSRILLIPVVAAAAVAIALVASRPQGIGSKNQAFVPITPRTATTSSPNTKAASAAILKKISKGAGVAWEPSFEAAMARAKKTNTIVMVDFHATWCGPCRAMDEMTYPDPRVVAASRRFINVKVDVDKRGDVAAQYGISPIPTVIWIRPNGHPVAAVESFIPPGEFANLMQKAHKMSLKD